MYSFCFFCNNVCPVVCLCVNFFSVKNFSGTTGPRILKFGTNIGFDLLYCVRKIGLVPAVGICICDPLVTLSSS